MSVRLLCDLQPGQQATIERVTSPEPLGTRLRQVGFQPGEQVRRTYVDAHGFLSAYTIENACIALRRPDAATVLVRV